MTSKSKAKKSDEQLSSMDMKLNWRLLLIISMILNVVLILLLLISNKLNYYVTSALITTVSPNTSTHINDNQCGESSTEIKALEFADPISPNRTFYQIPHQLLVSDEISRIWKIHSNLTNKQLNNIWKDAESKSDWEKVSTLKDQSQDLSIRKLTYKVGKPLEQVLVNIGKFLEEKFLVKLKIDGEASKYGHDDSLLQSRANYDYNNVFRLKGDPFIIRYDVNGVRELNAHKDNADVSFIMLINNPSDFDDGGTYFHLLNQTFFLKQGEILIFPGQLVHMAKPITRGKRFVMSGFLFFDKAFLDMKRLSTLATLPYLH